MAKIDITTLTQNFKGDVVTAEHPDYTQAIARWAANSERKATVIAFVKDNEDVVSAIKFAKANGLSLAVRGGGHHVGGASSVDQGLVIDLSRYMNGATVDPVKKLAYTGGGAIWETVDKAAIKHELATVGGTVNHTGVGGLVLGGGYGWLTAAHGLAIDNLVQATVVTADGSILTANAEQNQDLYFALRGGGGNFGVVTEFVLQLHPQRPTVYAGLLIFAPPSLEKLVETTRNFWATVGEHEGFIQVTTLGPDGNPVIVMIVFYNGSEAEGRARFKPFFDIGPVVDQTKEIPYEELNGLQNPMVPHGNGIYWKGVANKHPHAPTVAKALDKIVELAKTDGLQGSVLYEFFPLIKVSKITRDATAFRREMVNNVLINIAWDQKVADRTKDSRKHAAEFADILIGSQSEMTNSESLGYSNYDPDSTGVVGDAVVVVDKAKLVFGANYPKLQAIKKRYDPENIFNKWFPITPA